MFKALLIAKRTITHPGDYPWDEVLSAYSDFYYFTTLAKAQGFCQQYFTTPCVWDDSGVALSSRTPTLDAVIYPEKDIVIDPVGKPPLPNDFSR